MAGPLLAEIGVDPVLAIDDLDDALARRVIDMVMAGEPEHAHLAVRTRGGYTLLRERAATPEPEPEREPASGEPS